MSLIWNYSPSLLLAAIAAAFLAPYLAMGAVRRGMVNQGAARRYWLVLGVLILGFGIWTVHIVGLAAYRMPGPATFSIAFVSVAFMIAAAAAGLSIYIVSRPGMGLRQWLTGGVTVGVLLAAAHYAGLASVQISATLQYDAFLFPLSLVVSIATALAMLIVFFRFREMVHASAHWQLGGAATVAVGLFLAHVIGMAALIMQPGAPVLLIEQSLYAVNQNLLVLLMGALLLALLLLAPVLVQLLRSQAVELIFVSRFNIWLVAVGLLMLALLLATQWFIARAFTMEVTLVQVGYRVQAQAAQAHLGFERWLIDGAGIDPRREVYSRVDDAQATVRTSLAGVFANGTRRFASAHSEHLHAELQALDILLSRWRAGLADRIEGRTSFALGSPGELELDQSYMAIVTLADDVTLDATELERLNREVFLLFNAGSVALFVLFFGSLVMIMRRRQRDIQNKNSELAAALEELEHQKQALDQHAMVVVLDATGKAIYANDHFCESSGYQRQELQGREVGELLSAPSELVQATAKGAVWRGELTNRRRDGSVYWTSTTAVPFKNREGRVVRTLIIQNDVTAVKQGEQALRAQRFWLDTLIDAIPDGVILMDGNGRLLVANQVARQVFQLGSDYQGKTRRELAERSPAHRESMLACQASDEAVWGKGQPMEMDEIIPLPNGLTRTFHVIKVPLFHEDGTRKGLVVVGRDITARQRMESENVLLSTIIQQALESVFVTDTAGKLQYVNPAYEHMTGYAREEVVGQPPPILHASSPLHVSILSALARGETWSGRFEGRRRDGSPYMEELGITPIYDAGGRVINYVGIGRDVTERQRAEERMQQMQKLEAIGTLAGGIAHDFNNVLAGMLGYLELALDELPSDTQAADYLRDVLKAADRAKHLVRQILTFSHGSGQERQVFEPQPIVKEALKLLRATLPASIAIDQRLAASEAVLDMDPVGLHQIVMNLCINAAQAMDGGPGTLSVHLESLAPDDPALGASPGAEPGTGYIHLVVGDTGSGVPPEIRERIFEPFFTTKAPGEGTGMGLATVYGIVNASRGFLRVESQPGKGAWFHVYLPQCETELAVVSAPASETQSETKGRVLCVDDELALTTLSAKLLRRAGYEVEAYTDPAKALKAFREHPDRYDLLFTDRTMPGLTGEQLAAAVHALRPELPVVLCTGRPEQIDLEAAGIQECLLKPFASQDLLSAVQRLMEARRNREGDVRRAH